MKGFDQKSSHYSKFVVAPSIRVGFGGPPYESRRPLEFIKPSLCLLFTGQLQFYCCLELVFSHCFIATHSVAILIWHKFL